ncbi:hypothetical protein BCE75_11152 [Isoptericola sp. CG 20/1183]|uniref:Uncharacterized protein n=1 Tax=Isoptericola halotolerans TaxID=300560 RepID=A0ABX5EL46_9MICO|nr:MULTISPECIES: hypothetical protein [Isoptericola]MCK0117569.1 hypothetical protein [Isoptericola sp. S6320L]PRZ04131.1 hypothetical protein BCE75_11152 [Isoptericola sp. CG 20/1183]PRZ10044.1 hypothetical protein BCL65_101182 [Isoptericola halotolerans]
MTGDRARRLLPTAALAVVVLVALTACAAGPNPTLDTASTVLGEPAGFWLGLWQGMILPVTFVVSLFTDTVSVYEVHNNGNWYDVGYVLGISFVFGGPLGASRARR